MAIRQNPDRVATLQGLIGIALCALSLAFFLDHVGCPSPGLSEGFATSDFKIAQPSSLTGVASWHESSGPGAGDQSLGLAQLTSRIVVARHFKSAAALDLCGMGLRSERRLPLQSESTLRSAQFCTASLHVLHCLWLA